MNGFLNLIKDIPPWDWPEDAGKRFLELLRDDTAPEADRLLAAHLAGDSTVVDDELAQALLEVVKNAHASEAVRSEAAISLGPVLEEADTEGFGDFGEPPIEEKTFVKIQESFRAVHEDTGAPPLVRRRVLEASVRAPQDWHAGAVRSALERGDPEWKLTAVFSMRWVRGFDREILEALESDNPPLQRPAVEAAGTWGIDAAWPHVAALCASKETDKDLLISAIYALAEIRAQEAEAILVALADSPDEDISDAANDAMSMAEALGGGLKDDDDVDDEDLEDEDEKKPQ